MLFIDYNKIKLEINNLINENKFLQENQNKINNKLLNQLKPPNKYIRK
jgi:hypothetical protein